MGDDGQPIAPPSDHCFWTLVVCSVTVHGDSKNLSDNIFDAKKAIAMSQARFRYKQACSSFFLTVFVIIGFTAAGGSAQTAPEVERRVNDLLAKMTLQEKVGQLQQLDGDP